MKSSFVHFALCLSFFVSSVHAKNDIEFILPQPVELALVISVLSELDPNGEQVRRGGDYESAIKDHFSPFAEHELFKVLGSNFNLPRLAGNAADFAFDENQHLVEIDTSGSLWGDSEGDLFRKHLKLIEDFALKSRFLRFFNENKTLYRQAIESVSSQIDSADMVTWLQRNFSARPGAMQIIISPLIGGLNWTTLYKPQTRMWVAAKQMPKSLSIDDYDRILEAYSVFTELDHSYVNPATKTMLSKVEQAFSNTPVWVKEGSSASSYTTTELVFNEYMTWATYLMYASDKLNAESFDRLSATIVNFMRDSRGFIAFDDFNSEAIRLYSKEDKTAEASMLELVSWASSYQVK